MKQSTSFLAYNDRDIVTKNALLALLERQDELSQKVSRHELFVEACGKLKEDLTKHQRKYYQRLYDMMMEDFSCQNWSNLQLSGRNLTHANFSCACLRKVQAVGTSFVDADLVHVDLRGACLRGADFSFAEMVGVNLRGADLTGATFHHTDLRWADLRGAIFSGNDMTGTDLEDAIGVPDYLLQSL
ncbi:putative low-complexity protein [Brevibacillus agri BAB-2500]|nr:putative low-complexity protein [Brevibacillus agri BAB-2500]